MENCQLIPSRQGQEFYLHIKNNTNVDLPIILFDNTGTYNSQNSLGLVKKYSWDITAELSKAAIYNFDQLALLAAPPVGNYRLLTYTNPAGTFTTAAEVVVGLNLFGIGTFTSIGNTIYCEFSTNVISSINLTLLVTATHTSNASWGLGGSLIYSAGYNQFLIGSLTRINTGNLFWINQIAQTNGPLNRSNVDGSPGGDVEGLFANINVNSAQIVYIGFSSSTDIQLYINNQLIISVQSPSEKNAVAANVNTILGTSFSGTTILSDCWHIIPVNLIAGLNLLQVLPIKAVFAIEVYANTSMQIENATNYAELNMFYRSTEYLGQQLF